MPERMTPGELDYALRTDLQRGLSVIQRRAARNLASGNPWLQAIGAATLDKVGEIRERARASRSRSSG